MYRESPQRCLVDMRSCRRNGICNCRDLSNQGTKRNDPYILMPLRNCPPTGKSNYLVQLTLSSALFLVGVIKLIESVGKHFTAQHLYLTMVLIGLILISIECLRRLPSDPAGVKEEA